MNKEMRIAKCKTAIQDYENNLASFKSGAVVPQPGEVQSNKRALSLRKEELSKLESSQTAQV